MKEVTTNKKKAIIIYDGRANHYEGCNCDQCDQHNYSYGVSIYLATQEDLYLTDEEFDVFFAREETHATFYACSEVAAYSQAEMYCFQAGIEVGMTV